MKIINRYIAVVAVLALLFTSCSKEESTSPADDPEIQSVDLTFGAMLNDLSNRAAVSNKAHFDEVPDCSDAPPAIALIGFSYGGNSYETDVAVKSDGTDFFTDYSEDLKIPVPNNGSVEVTLDSFKVFDGNVSEGKPYGELIWIAPIESEEGEFDGYVDSALPFSFDVEDGTKPYIDVEVLCFDRRMVNEYGYVFFDILPEVIYPLCLFVNYCDENGRHYVADYSVDLYFGTDATGIQLYDNLEESAMATTGDYGEGAYYADPLCLVVPGPPANLPANQPYLYLVIHPEDWDGTGDIDNTPTQGIPLTWEMVSGLLNEDGTTNEYQHFLIGECDGAIGSGDGGGNGGTECNPSSPNADCDNDEILNKCDPDNANYAGFDCDGDSIDNGQENEGCVNNPDPNCGENNTECQAGDKDEDGICDDIDTDVPCTTVSTAENATIDVSAAGPPPPTVLLGELGDGVVIITNTTTENVYSVEIILDAAFTATDNIEEYYLSLTQNAAALEVGPVDVDADSVEFEVNLSDFDTSAEISIDAYIIYCSQ